MLIGWVLTMLLQAAAPAPAGQAVVTGQLQMTDGSPAEAVRVAVMPGPNPTVLPSQGQNYYATQAPVAVTITDAKGAFAFAKLPPGRYIVVAGAAGHATYHPGTTDIDDATVVVVEAGAPPQRVDFRLQRSPGARVRGRVTPALGTGQERAVLSGVSLGEILESPVRPDGTFEFGRMPAGTYFLSLYPTPSGMPSARFDVAEQDAVNVDLVKPPAWTVSGRLVSQNGPLPPALLGFTTVQGYVPAEINPDGTFTARLHEARHTVELGGMPIGYSLASVHQGTNDLRDFQVPVDKREITDLVITVAAPKTLPRLRGRIAGYSASAAARVVAAGPITGTVEVPVSADGTFEFAALPPGLYRLTVPQMPAIPSTQVVVTSTGGETVLGG